MTRTPLVSVVIPTRNRAARLRRTLDSVLAQTYRDLDVIVVDDGSTDDTEAVVRAVTDPRVRYERKGPPHSAAGARNHGVGLARGEWVAFNDCGDEWLPVKVAVQVDAVSRLPGDVAMVYSDLARVFTDGRRQDLLCPVFNHDDAGVYRRALAMGISGVYPQTALIRTAVFKELGGFDETLRCWEDLEFFFRVVKAHRIQFTPGALTLLYEDSRGVSANLDALYDAHRRILAKYAADLGGDLELLVPHYRGAGRQLIRSAHRDYAREVLWKAALSPYRQPLDFVFLALSYGGEPAYRAARAARRAYWRLRGAPPPLDSNGGIGA